VQKEHDSKRTLGAWNRPCDAKQPTRLHICALFVDFKELETPDMEYSLPFQCLQEKASRKQKRSREATQHTSHASSTQTATKETL